MSLTTVRGQQIALYPAGGRQTERKEHGRTYRLCQILPASPQRLEWIRLDNIIELPDEERNRLRRTPRPQSSSARLARADGRIEISPQVEDMIARSEPAQTPEDRAAANREFAAIIAEHEDEERAAGRRAA